MLKKNLKLIIGILFFFSACRDNGKIIVINFWAFGAESENVQKLLNEFEKFHPGIKVKVQAIPWTAAHEKLITAFASETTPDITQLGNTWIPEFAALNSLEELKNLVKYSEVIKERDFFPGIWKTNKLGEKLFGIPWYVDTRVLFYRKDLMEKAGFPNPPRTWQELHDAAFQIKKNSSLHNCYPLFLPTSEWAPFIIFGMQNGAALLKDHNTLGNFSDPKFEEAFKYLINFYKDDLAPVAMTGISNVYQAFEEGYIAMYITGPWNVTEFKNRLTNNNKIDWQTAPLPSPNNIYPGASIAGGSSLVIFKNSKCKNEAWKLIEFLSSKKAQVNFFKVSSDLPAVKEAWDDSILVNDKYLKAFYDQLQNVLPMPQVPEWEQIVFSKLQQYAEYAARGRMGIKEALNHLDNDADKILEKRRWMVKNKL